MASSQPQYQVIGAETEVDGIDEEEEEEPLTEQKPGSEGGSSSGQTQGSCCRNPILFGANATVLLLLLIALVWPRSAVTQFPEAARPAAKQKAPKRSSATHAVSQEVHTELLALQESYPLLEELLRSLARRERRELRLASLGSSFAQDEEGVECSWLVHLEQWVQKREMGTNVSLQHTHAGVGLSCSFLPVLESVVRSMEGPLDLVFVESSANVSLETPEEESLCYGLALRTLREVLPDTAIISIWAGPAAGADREALRRRVAAPYNIPVLESRPSMQDQLTAGVVINFLDLLQERSKKTRAPSHSSWPNASNVEQSQIKGNATTEPKSSYSAFDVHMWNYEPGYTKPITDLDVKRRDWRLWADRPGKKGWTGRFPPPSMINFSASFGPKPQLIVAYSANQSAAKVTLIPRPTNKSTADQTPPKQPTFELPAPRPKDACPSSQAADISQVQLLWIGEEDLALSPMSEVSIIFEKIKGPTFKIIGVWSY